MCAYLLRIQFDRNYFSGKLPVITVVDHYHWPFVASNLAYSILPLTLKIIPLEFPRGKKRATFQLRYLPLVIVLNNFLIKIMPIHGFS